jgi:hypothetical protein
MPFEVPKYFSAETRSVIETALEDALQELSKDTLFDAAPTKKRLVRTMVALAAVGETDLKKLKSFAINAWRASSPEQTIHSRASRTAA